MRHESLFFLYSSVTRLKGVGAAAAKSLQRLLPSATALSGANLPIIRDLLFHLPIGLVDRSFTCPLSEAPDGVVATFVVRVDQHEPPQPGMRRRGSRRPYKVHCSNETGEITLVFFNAKGDYLPRMLPEGRRVAISGKIEHFENRLQMAHPDVIAPAHQLEEVQRPDPVYPLTVGLTSKRIGNIVDDALDRLPELPEWIEPAWVEQHRWPTWKAALAHLHHPESIDDLDIKTPARERLAYDEMLANQLYLGLLRYHMQKVAGTIIKGTGTLTGALQKALPFTLNTGQLQVIEEINEDMLSGHRMARLLQGDVGAGKTVVAVMAMLRVVEDGYQAALMVPTSLIARQHYNTLSQFSEVLGIRVALLTGAIKGKARQEILDDLASGKIAIVVGTHALFQEQVVFYKLALAVIDEQHRFGVDQRMALLEKGEAPHLLHMTATPIPRSLTMTMYGDMECSILKEKPAERQDVVTRVIPLSRYDDVMERLQVALDNGEKVYWICPLIEERYTQGELELTPEGDLAAAETRYTEFKTRFGDKVGMVHGKMKQEERDEAMHHFANGALRLLVATTVVEVGVDIRDATIMVIEQAERFGLSQLHQLRGRVGRGDQESSCVLLYNDSAGETARSRLSILRDSHDGFVIADADLHIRGSGDLLGTRQSGLPRFIFSDLVRHRQLLEHARDDAVQVIEDDTALQTPRGKALSLLLQLFGFEYKADEAEEQVQALQ